MKTIQELKDERARQLTIMEDAVRATREANLTVMSDDDRLRFDGAKASIAELDTDIVRTEAETADALRMGEFDTIRSRFDVPNINVKGGNSVRGDRTLDEALWATNERVRASNGAFNDVEQVVIRNADGDAVQAPRLTAFRADQREIVRTFQQTVADMAVWGLLTDKQARSSSQGFEAARSHRVWRDRWTGIMRALDTDTSGEGGTWVPTGIGASLHEKVRAEGKVAALFGRIDLPTNPWKWPIEGADATAYLVAEPTGDAATAMTASTPGTVAATFDAEIFGARALFSRSLEADSAVAILSFVQAKLVQAFVAAEEKAILDGDADGTHQDSDTNTAGATSASWAWDGLRKRALANASVATTTSTAANLAIIRALMGKWGINPADQAFIVGVSAYHDLLVDTNVLTVDKLGPNATILSGQLASIYGVPIIVSEHVRENLNASGVHDGITQTKTYNLCVNRREWVMGQRMALDVEVDDSIFRQTYQRVLVGFMREDFQNIGDASGNDDTAVGFNVTP